MQELLRFAIKLGERCVMMLFNHIIYEINECAIKVFLTALLSLTGFDMGVNKQLMIVLSGLSLGPPRLPVMPCPHDIAVSIAQKYRHIFPEC